MRALGWMHLWVIERVEKHGRPRHPGLAFSGQVGDRVFDSKRRIQADGKKQM